MAKSPSRPAATWMDLRAFVVNLNFLYYRIISERFLWRSNTIEISINLKNVRELSEYCRTAASFKGIKELEISVNKTEKWLEKHGNLESLSTAEVESYYDILSDMHLALTCADILNRDYLLFDQKYCEEYCSVLKVFPELSEDLLAAAHSYGCGLGTAAVFHLSRALELALQRLVSRLKIKLGERQNTWAALTDRLNSYLNSIPTSTKAQREKKRNIAQIVNHLNGVRIAWRNDVMHPGRSYSKLEAGRVFDNVLLLLHDLTNFIGESRTRATPQPASSEKVIG